MNGKELYKIYAPNGAKWIEWVRPVSFVAIDKYKREPTSNWIDRKIMFLKTKESNTAIFIDLPGAESIELGISLAKIGYRPIPLFNGTDEQKGAKANNNNRLIENYLINGARILKNIKLEKDANPVFLLDSYRTNRYRLDESIFDNSWDLYGQDIPSVEYFRENGISKVIIVGNLVQKDLKKIFLRFQSKGIEIYLTDGYKIPQKVKLVKTIKERFEKEEL